MNAYSVEVFGRYLAFKTAADELCGAFESAFDCAVRQRSGGFSRVEALPSEQKRIDPTTADMLTLKYERAWTHLERLSELVVGAEIDHFVKMESEFGGWMGGDIKKKNFYGAFRNLEELVRMHIPLMETGLFAWLKSAKHLHQKLAHATDPLLAGGEFDSAVRKAFVLLSETLREKCAAGDDGTALIGKAFGGDHALLQPMGYDQKAVVQFLDGFYKLFRNRHAHHDQELAQPETQAILAVVNWAILFVETAKPSPPRTSV